MLTICIPTYNFDVIPLVSELIRQASIINKPYEIILIDDFSNQQTKEINNKLSNKVTSIELPKNIGRSKIRNLFLNHANYNYLLFLDCDSLIETQDFLSNYFEIIKQNPSVVCGGRIYDKNPPSREKMLRWKYGIKKESQPFQLRNRYPNKSFMTNNFLIDRKLFEKIKFDERISQYGHEDTLFGYSLKKENISILHIDNPVKNGDIENNLEYLRKTEEGIINLVHIIEYADFDKELTNEITLLLFYNKIRTIKGFIYFTFKITKPVIWLLLSRGYINLPLFNFYKLGIFIENYNNKTS